MGEPIRIWRYHDAPQVLQDLSDHGGDEDWLALVPKEIYDAVGWLGWLENGIGVSSTSRHELLNGDIVFIGANA